MSRSQYPLFPGYQNTDTSFQAAADIAPTASDWRSRCLAYTMATGADGTTADECAAALQIDKLTIRPRFSELRKLGRINDSGRRRNNASTKSAIVWISTVKPMEIANDQ